MNAVRDTVGKISRPRLHTVFKRTRLFRLIDECRAYPVIWISGLPGAGKTTLAASYMEDRRLPGLWYQMDGGDDDAASFFHYLTLSAKKGFPRSRSLPRELSPEHFSNLRHFAIRYFRSLFSLLKKPSLLVFDNYHEVPDGSGLQEIAGAGLEQVPAGINILILSRSGPPPALTKLLLNGSVAIIRPEELSLSAEEAVGMARLRDKWQASLESVPTFFRYTGGWAAGLVLMLECGEPNAVVSGAPNEMAKESFFNYFAGEIFDKMDSVVKDFLLKTSCLPSFTSATAKELTGVPQAAHILAEMNRKNYFTERKIQRGTVYRFHPLFREFLLSRAENEMGPRQLKDTYRKAAGLLVEHGRPEDAFSLYMKTGDVSARVSLVRRHAPVLMAQRRLGLLEEWLETLPGETLDTDPWLLYWSGQCRLPFDPLESRNIFARSLERFRSQADIDGLVMTVSGAVEAILNEWGDFRQLDVWIKELDRLIKRIPRFSSKEIEARAVFAMFSALMWRQPQHPDMEMWAGRMMGCMRSGLGADLRLVLGQCISHYRSWTGDIGSVAFVVDIMRELVKVSVPPPLVFMTWKMQEAIYFWHLARFDDCLAAVNEGLAEAERSGVHVIDNWLLAQGVYATLCDGDLRQAAYFLDRMKPILNTRRYLDISHYNYLRGLYHLQSGQMEVALEFSRGGLDLARDVGTPFPEGLNCIAFARILHETGETERAEGFNARALSIGSGMNSSYLEMMSCLNDAYFALRRSEEKRLITPLRKAMAIGRRKGLVNFAGWDQAMMAGLCMKALEAGIEVKYVKGLIRRRNMLPDINTCEIVEWPWPLRIYTLGRFEIEIEGKPLRFTGKPQFKPLEMLKALVALGGKGVSQDGLEDLLWPEAEGGRGRRAMVTTLHRLRKLLGNEKIVELSEKRVSLKDRYCWVDVWALDNLFERVRNVFEDNPGEDEISCLADGILDLYKGDFLKNESDSPWVRPSRERIRSMFLRRLGLLGGFWEERHQYQKAADIYLRALETDDLAEEFYQHLMECYLREGRIAEALAVYERCRQVLSSALGINPSALTESIRKSIRRDAAGD